MAAFSTAFDQMIRNEGGYVLHTVAGDRGGMTFAGIARNFWGGWPGWRKVSNWNVGTFTHFSKTHVSNHHSQN